MWIIKMFVAIGSTNKAKVEAVKEALKIIGLNADVISVNVESGVSSQPFCHETFVGARNRAYNALNATNADIGIGIEGGICYYENKYLAFAVVYAANKEGLENFSFSMAFSLPSTMVKHILEGKELGEATDLIFSTKDSKQHEGAIGYLTKVITRKELYIQPVIAALYPFYNKIE
ncbi:inosine/xanthosine triphosphatase [Sulfurisphaera ohwakuensis]|uniref:Probable inosine/xanthosine triphosphatase n=2 Tax=Sulfurisphaera ohwakuensis TaxID=69656 RepID=A0A7J9RR97_SULOH|nr:inosine/xanthosine triphosphatase [Sulfurisphaera ohwakuensis]MBB5253443.1 inosine/xanthosine triphosphatase [Sulfurisphaera ohwakuensis]